MIQRMAFALGLFLSFSALAQLPRDTKSDLGPDVPAFRVRPGYRVTRVIPDKAVRDIRFIQFSNDGKTLFISDRENGMIYALRDPDENGIYKTITTFLKNRRSVQGMDARDGWLYFSQASEGSVSRARDTNNDGVADDVEEIIPRGTLPQAGGHPFEGLLVTDSQIYVTSSDPTNMTEDLDSDRKRIYVFDRDGKNQRTFVTGVRNVEKLRFRPGTREIWGFDHGSDNFGASFGERIGRDQPITDLNPPEELNRFIDGAFYGHPFIMGNGVPRPEFAKRKDIIELANKTTQPEWLIHAHWAVLGFTFIHSDYFGTDGARPGDVFFASHGSWNSIKPVGACVQRIMFDPLTGKPFGSQTIVDCQGPDRRFARPVDCAEAPDGSVIFSSDEPSALYRISRSK
ncbi:sorbosone dehydrogenase family protein [soil metagenome]